MTVEVATILAESITSLGEDVLAGLVILGIIHFWTGVFSS